MSETNVQKFKRLLSELFMFDHADLDFGIYRIMNAKRDEIRRFLDDDLLPQVRKEIEHLDTGKREQLLREREETLQQLRGLLVADPENNPKIREIDAQLGQSVDVTALENEIFSDLYDFFRRYYSEGDYLALRRYKEGVYAIPYEGEEVKLHWANADQYYIKTSEYFRDYTFKLPDHRRVHFKLTSADTEQNNNKSTNGEKRVFILCADDFIEEENGELVICFEYRVDPQKRKQEELNQEAAQRILSVPNLTSWMMILGRPAPTDSSPDRTFLQKYLADYTSRNTFDYFIHKDLGAFLRRELDFFIKNEIMHLDDIEHESAPRVEVYLSKIKALRRVARKVIDFLEQLENFQKKLWLKKKFVIETNYCVTLDRIPEELYPEIAGNDAQRREWVRLFAIDKINSDLIENGYTDPISVAFLQANRFLVLDTRFFDPDFKYKLIASWDGIDDNLDGLVIHSDNFHALSFLKNKYDGRISSVYIDPPYNTSATEIIYKNSYKHSSWLSFLYDRMTLSTTLMAENGILCATIDDYEAARLHLAFLDIFGEENHLATVSVRSKPQGRATAAGFSANHEYAIFFKKSPSSEVGRLPREGSKLARYNEEDEHGIFTWANFRKTGGDSRRIDRPKSFYPIYVHPETSILRIPDMKWDDRQDAWQVLESPEDNEVVIYPIDTDGNERVWSLGSERAVNELNSDLITRVIDNEWQIYRKYRPNQEGSLPGTWWDDAKYSASESGTKILNDVLGADNIFSFPKSIYAVEDCLRATNLNGEDVVLDYFAGSGTTGHAVINLNREDKATRKYILVEVGEYFDSVLIPRLMKAAYSNDWSDGKPVSRKGTSHCFKYIRLESYEDALNNLRLHLTPQQQKLLWDTGKDHFREDYILRYMLDVEAKGSTSLLDVKQFINPFNYQLEIGTGTVGETRPATIDLVETFNYLLGLHVRRIQAFDYIRVVEGENRDGQQILIIWRNQEEIDNAKLDAFFQENGGHEANFDLIYVNGDNNLENLKQGNEIWQVLLIEEAFHQLMFDTQDV